MDALTQWAVPMAVAWLAFAVTRVAPDDTSAFWWFAPLVVLVGALAGLAEARGRQ